jgi:hypothetical protein
MVFIMSNIVNGMDYPGEKDWYPEKFQKDLAQD